MPEPKKHYLIIACTKCGRFLLASSAKRTRLCAYCGCRVRLDRAKVIARSENAKEARAVLKETKFRNKIKE